MGDSVDAPSTGMKKGKEFCQGHNSYKRHGIKWRSFKRGLRPLKTDRRNMQILIDERSIMKLGTEPS